ncbi:hypothetical protein PAPHI01_0429 [Pancytospora philotis]|nr:hypothetical protein PAPHI01_0429 [Pancytospora philotis]
MLARIPAYLLLAYCATDKETAVKPAPSFPRNDYVYFGDIVKPGYNPLEVKILDQLFKICLKYGSGEITSELTSGQLRSVDSNSKARAIAYSIIADRAWPALLEEQLLSKLGYAGHLLLKKVLCKVYARDRSEMPNDGHNKAALHRTRLGNARERLQALVRAGANEGLQHLVEHGVGINNAFDIVIYIHNTMRHLGTKMLPRASAQLFGLLLSDAGSREKFKSTIYKAVRIALQPDVFSAPQQTALSRRIVKYVVSDGRRDSFVFFRIPCSPVTISRYVAMRIKKQKYENVSPEFVLNYIEYIKGAFNFPEQALDNLFHVLIPSFGIFHSLETKWRDDAKYFDAISPGWLRRMFKDLDVNARGTYDREVLILKYMVMLSPEKLSLVFEKCR